MEILLLDQRGKDHYRNDLLKLCQNADQEFVPPLSQRSSTTQSSLQGGREQGIYAYFDGIMAQPMLACVEDGLLLGFVAYKENYVPEHYASAKLPNIYISTLILAPESRGRGLTKTLYRHLFYERFPACSVYTRTWSQNAAHIKILKGFDFVEVCRIADHRGDGIDTVYYELRR